MNKSNIISVISVSCGEIKPQDTEITEIIQTIFRAEMFEWVGNFDRLEECVKGKWEEGPLAKRRYFEYRIASQLPLTQSGAVHVNFVEVWERNKTGRVIYHNSWVTDFDVTAENVAKIIGIGRSRWKIENEQFNIHKNHGYELEHNYGHGQHGLSLVFYLLNLLAFVAHPVLEMGDRRYQQARAKESRRCIWEQLRVFMTDWNSRAGRP